MLNSMKWHSKLCAALLTSLLVSTPLLAQANEIQLHPEDKHIQLAQLDRRGGEPLREMKVDAARAALLSTLYPGLGQLYVGNDNERSLWVMGGGTLVIVGSIAGFALLADRPPEASTLGNVLIMGVLLGYHLWNVRDAYNQAEVYNRQLEKDNLIGVLNQIQLSAEQGTLSLSWRHSF